jgi:hypothetical protein
MSDWQPCSPDKAKTRSDLKGTTFQVEHDDGRWARVRFRSNGAIDVTVGPKIHTVDGLWNNAPGQTSLSLIPKL